MHADMPSSPQALINRVLDNNSSVVEVMWEPPSNDSRVDFYHYQVVGAGAIALYQGDTINTTVTLILPDILYDINITFILSANNCEGRSLPVRFVVNIGKIF